jgi:hypothetical protein
MHGDVEASVAHGVIGGREAAGIPELGQDGGGSHQAHAEELFGKDPTSPLAPGEAAKGCLKGAKLVVKGVENAKAHLDQALPGRGQLGCPQTLAPFAGCELDARPHALVKQLGLHALLPLDALIDKGLSQPHECAQREDVGGGNPCLGEASLH